MAGCSPRSRAFTEISLGRKQSAAHYFFSRFLADFIRPDAPHVAGDANPVARSLVGRKRDIEHVHEDEPRCIAGIFERRSDRKREVGHEFISACSVSRTPTMIGGLLHVQIRDTCLLRLQ